VFVSRLPPFDISASRHNGDVTLTVSGELDLSTSPGLRASLDEHRRLGTNVVLDLSSVSYMDSSGLNVLIAAIRRSAATGPSLRVRDNASEQVVSLLQMTGAHDYVPWT
jgi:anti-anti-sigma factor